MRVAVLGAGITGTCVALELADAGCNVDLYERAPRPLLRASLNNEGKIHLGLVYANDGSGWTAETMIRGAVWFRALLARWVNAADIDDATSTPFLYAVPHDSMLTPEEIRRHFERVSTLFGQASKGMSNAYVHPVKIPLWTEMEPGEFSAIFDRQHVQRAFETQERAVDPRRICESLRAALDAATGIALRCQTDVEGVARDGGGGFRVRSRHAERDLAETYDVVVNALWEQRLAVDASAGLHTSRPVVHRYKVGLRTSNQVVAAGLPSVTFMLGSYGDTVAYAGGAYVSWYPAGLLRQDFALRPPVSDLNLEPGERARIIARSLEGVRKLMPGASTLLDPSAVEWEVVGGFITAWGQSGIDDRRSELHHRYAVGVSTHGNYHTIDTGKFTLAPLFAAEACARILGRALVCA